MNFVRLFRRVALRLPGLRFVQFVGRVRRSRHPAKASALNRQRSNILRRGPTAAANQLRACFQPLR